jgi:hypothetical protein
MARTPPYTDTNGYTLVSTADWFEVSRRTEC